MAYGIEYITKVETWTAASEYADDTALDIDVTSCMLNGELTPDCDEWKEGTINGRIEIDCGITPSSITQLYVRAYVEELKTAGDFALLPYTDINSVDSTNEIIVSWASTGWKEHQADSNFISDLGAVDGGTAFAVRFAAPGGGKSKVSEVEIDLIYPTTTLSGVTRDEDLDPLGSCEVHLFKVTAGTPDTLDFVESQISNAVTGAYSFTIPDAGFNYVAIAHKADTPHVYGMTELELQGA